MIRNTPMPPVQKLRSRSAQGASLYLFMDSTVHTAIKCATVRQHSELRSNERDISTAYVLNCALICSDMLTNRHNTVTNTITKYEECLLLRASYVILTMNTIEV